jgi:CRISPR-associated protein Cas1
MPRPYWIFSSGRIRRKENTILFEASDGKRYIPVEDIEEIHLFGEVDLNTKLLNFLSQHGIPVHVYNYYGFYAGSYMPRETRVSGFVLVKQVEHYIDYEKRIFLAKSFVDGALWQISRNLSQYDESKKLANEVEKIQSKIYGCGKIEEIMSYEGRAREIYYKIFEKVFDLEFVRRTRQPPMNPANAMISFGNSILYSVILTEIYKTPLNPTISYLHEPSHKRFSLSLDISEIFKPIIVDRVIFHLLSKGQIDEGDFDQNLNYCYLSESGRKKFVSEIDNRLSQTVFHAKLKRKVSFRGLIRLELYKLLKHIIGDENYSPLKSWW